MPVFATHRTATMPDFILAAAKNNAVNTKMVEGGNGLENFEQANPFPIPKDGLEAIWNHITRYRGGSGEASGNSGRLRSRTAPIAWCTSRMSSPSRGALKDADTSKPSNVLFLPSSNG